MPDQSDCSKPDAPLTRRHFLGRFAALGAAGLGGSTLLAACGGGEEVETLGEGEYAVVEASTCEGFDALDEQALAAREALNYQDVSSEEGEYCGNCQFQQQYAEDESCLGCTLFAGPVSPAGWCVSWAAMQS